MLGNQAQDERLVAESEADADSEDDENDDSDDENVSDDDGDEYDDDANEYDRELRAERQGVSYEKASKVSERKRKQASVPSVDKAATEEKELAKLMMSRKKQRLYDRMQFGIKRKEAAAQALRDKRAAIEEAAQSRKGTSEKKRARVKSSSN